MGVSPNFLFWVYLSVVDRYVIDILLIVVIIVYWSTSLLKMKISMVFVSLYPLQMVLYQFYITLLWMEFPLSFFQSSAYWVYMGVSPITIFFLVYTANEFVSLHPLHTYICLHIYIIHNIIQIRNNVMWDCQYFAYYSPHSIRMWEILCKLKSIPHNGVMNLNNITLFVHVVYFLKIWNLI